jgi:hypothetical protein
MRNSIAVRLALMFATAALAGFAVLGGALHHVLSNEFERHQREQLNARLEDMAYMLQHGRASNLGERIRDKLDTLVTDDSRTPAATAFACSWDRRRGKPGCGCVAASWRRRKTGLRCATWRASIPSPSAIPCAPSRPRSPC